jgi:hypothetical protein
MAIVMILYSISYTLVFHLPSTGNFDSIVEESYLSYVAPTPTRIF